MTDQPDRHPREEANRPEQYRYPLDSIGLPKWPALLVTGKRVTLDQAIEINFRTASSWWSTNDKEFLEFIAESIGASIEGYGYLNFTQEMREKWGHLSLEYLCNSNIVSSYIGGPHGWCSWDGHIFANSYNIGKYPSVVEVHSEWEQIAKAFPFLSLRCQLLDGESSEDGDRKALVEYVIEDGKVEAFVPEDPTPMVANVGLDFNMVAALFNSRLREHGTEQQFTERYNRFKELRGL